MPIPAQVHPNGRSRQGQARGQASKGARRRPRDRGLPFATRHEPLARWQMSYNAFRQAIGAGDSSITQSLNAFRQAIGAGDSSITQSLNDPMTQSLNLFMVAGERSGDVYGGE